MISRKLVNSKLVWLGICLTVVVLIISIITLTFYDRKHIIEYSEIIIGNDIRNKYLDIVVTRNDSVLKFESRDKNKQLTFKSNNGNYNLKMYLKGTEVICKKFRISENKPKYIYAFFESENSNYYNYYDSIVSREITKRTQKKAFSRNELRKIIVEIKQGITIVDLEELGYDVKKEKFKLYVREESFMKD